MRGKRIYISSSSGSVWITPAYAGKTINVLTVAAVVKDHPRVCGENCQRVIIHRGQMGSPPRMRGKLIQAIVDALPQRITPAYAGKTEVLNYRLRVALDHPRVCGENQATTSSPNAPSGSPPRMRGKLEDALDSGSLVGITPAYAGKTILR